MSARICTRSFASRFERGSSIRKTLGTRTIARPIATRWRCPPESCPGLRSRYSVSPSKAATSLTRFSRTLFFTLAIRKRKADVRRHREIRIQRVVLEDHRDVALLGREVGDVAVADEDRPGVDLLEAGEHPQRRRLSGAGWAHQHHELPVGDVQIECVDCGRFRSRIHPGRLDESDFSQCSPLLRAGKTPCRARGGAGPARRGLPRSRRDPAALRRRSPRMR